MLLGVIADDFTGATDIASMLARNGMRTVQTVGVPAGGEAPAADAVVVALKSRTIPAADAVRQSLAALDWLLAQGARQIVFKYCSTFDSTDAGNIGPVGEALLDRLGGIAVVCPAFPANKRTIYRGYLFVGDVLLSESSMKDHPLTPMTDPSLVRVMARQVRDPATVGLVGFETVQQGAMAISTELDRLRAAGKRFAVVDAVADGDLRAIGAAIADAPLLTGGSGIAMGLPDNFRRIGLLAEGGAAALAVPDGRSAVLAGSCSAATRGQVAAVGGRWPTMRLDPVELAAGRQSAAAVLNWAAGQDPDTPVLVYSTAEPEAVRAAQEALGRERAATVLEEAFAAVAAGLVGAGVRRMVVAGGETAGAVVGALGIDALAIGPEIDPGVPWVQAMGADGLCLALKSGNFGAEDFFAKAFARLG
ncbi:3-oxo-tetronate kinase [Stella sp.]|uniref:3-oxo-tetronate kinase n=1 Tax=Stella sp. TaxID=2912054 RepID=UPI0035B4DC64